jgi:aspartate aminotransferase
MKLSKRVLRIKPSATLAVDAKAKAMRKAGVDVVNFGAGEPDFATPENICQAAIRAMEAGHTRYTPVGGTDELKDAVIHKLREGSGLDYSRAEILVSCGGKHCFYNLCQALFEEDDEILLPAPYWVSYLPMITLSGATSVVVPASEQAGFKVHPEDLRPHVGRRTRALVVNSPSNPTGATYTAEELAHLARFAQEHDLLVISDEIYDRIVFNGLTRTPSIATMPGMRERTFVLNGVSKSYAMTGWRIGYLAGNAEAVRAMTKIQSQSTSNPNSIAQKAAVEALTGPQGSVETMRRVFEERCNYITDRLNAMPDVTCVRPGGAFYVFPNMTSYLGRQVGGRELATSQDLADYLLDEARVAVVPGSDFGLEGFVRLSYAISMENIAKGLDRIEAALAKLSMARTAA